MEAWTKQGLLLAAPLRLSWATSHAALPVVEQLTDGRLRIYFSARDAQGRARIGTAELASDLSGEPVFSANPVLDVGELGTFDDSGVTSSALVVSEDRRYLYYSGWSLGSTVPFYFYVGCAISDDGETWHRASPAPILERSEIDPYLTASPAILIENGVWRMWYVSGTGWTIVGGRPQHRYHIKYAESVDGLIWRRTGHVCIDYRDEAEYAIARPTVVKDGDRYRMWFSARGDAYRIYAAESPDGYEWQRLEEPVIGGTEAGWDDQMQAYPTVFDSHGHRHMLYNGNGYGATGIGHAVAPGV